MRFSHGRLHHNRTAREAEAPDDVRAAQMFTMIEKRRTEPFYLAHPSYIDDAMALMTGAAGGAPTISDILARAGAFYFQRYTARAACCWPGTPPTCISRRVASASTWACRTR